MEIKELTENTNKAIERLRKDRSLLDESISRRIAIRGEDGRVSGYEMNPIAREKIRQAQIDRWERVHIAKQSKSGPPLMEPMRTGKAPQQLDKKKFPFASKLQELMKEKSPSYWIQNLADDMQMSFEHARKMVKGVAVPTNLRVQAISQIFGADAGELIALAEADKFHRRYGEGVAASVFNPEVAPFAAAWPMLTDGQKGVLLEMLGKFVTENMPTTIANH